MASKNLRKLFPLSATSYNQSLDCPDFCDPSCPYNCPYPDFYFLPPPPPPPEHSGHSLHLSLAAIVSVSVLAGVFLVASYLFMIGRSCLRKRNGENESEEEYVEEHPVWLIATVGLRPAVINSITAYKYKRSEGLVEGTECSVCLTEFEEDETVRIMPKCNHAFHIPCIDTWLTSHTNCPLCRASVVSEPPQPEGTPLNADAHRDQENREDQTESPKHGDSVAIDIVVEEEQIVEAELRQPPIPMDCSSVVGGGEECSSGSDKRILEGGEKSDMV